MSGTTYEKTILYVAGISTWLLIAITAEAIYKIAVPNANTTMNIIAVFTYVIAGLFLSLKIWQKEIEETL